MANRKDVRNSENDLKTGRDHDLEPGSSPLRPNLRSTDPNELGSHIGADQIAFETVAQTSQDISSKPDSLLLCDDCSVVYDGDEKWAYCPRCGDDLGEVERP